VKDIKELIQAASRTIPKKDTVGTGDLVRPVVVKKDLEEIREKEKLVSYMGKYKRADDLINDVSLRAAKRVTMEMEFGKSSTDRLKAANIILDRSMGKPADRQISINMDIQGYQDQELNTEVHKLLGELGYTEAQANKILVEDIEDAVVIQGAESSTLKKENEKKSSCASS